MGKKGKTPQGRAGAKKKAQRGNASASSSPWQNNWATGSASRQVKDDDDDDYDYKGFRGFAQSNGNHNTPRTFTPQSSSSKLRYQAISFVPAAPNAPVDSTPSEIPQSEQARSVTAEHRQEENAALNEQDIDGSTLRTNNIVDTDLEVSEGGIARLNLHSSGEMSAEETRPTSSDVDLEGRLRFRDDLKAQEELFIVDTAGDNNLVPSPYKGKRPQRRASSPTPSDSSEDVIVFHGRGNAKTVDNQVQLLAKSPITAEQSNQSQRPTSSPQQAADPLAAWKTVARTLPQEYHNPTKSSPASKDAHREHTIRETFKKTSATQDRLGGPRNFETTEVTVHDAKGTRPTEPQDPNIADSASSLQEQPHVADDLINALTAQSKQENAWPSNPARARGWGASTSKADREVEPDAKWAPAPAGSWWRKTQKQPQPDLDLSMEETPAIVSYPPTTTKVSVVEPGSSKQVAIEEVRQSNNAEQGAEESIKSLQAEWKQKLRDKKRAKVSSREADEIALDVPKTSATSTRRGKRGRKRDNRSLRAPVEMEDDDEGEAAYDDYMQNLAAQIATDEANVDGVADFAESSFARSVGLGGASMVVDGQAFGDDEVLKDHAEMLNGDEAEWTSESDGPVGQDVSGSVSDDILQCEDLSDDSDDEQSSDLERRLEEEEREMWEDEEDLRQRKQDAMDDEHLAHLLAKQQQFGFGDDDLVIDDGFCMEGVGDVDAARAGLADMTKVVNSRSKPERTRRSGGRAGSGFPNASALADTVDQYGDAGFDIMDFERPSLRPTKKGRKGKLPAELEAISDDEMKENMSTAWENDRAKKRLKKAEREELRSQGMLGAMGKKGKADLTEKYKYQDGMSERQILEELREFLKDDGQRNRPFPPMGKDNRKRLHEVASQLNLKSKSVGAGNARYPVLYKTAKTVEYSDRLFRETMDASRNGRLALDLKFSRRAKKVASKGAGGKGGSGGGGGGMAAASINHGEIVGANAPEIGVENKGFKFMQKMGWTPGMSLGREGEGRLVPVEQMMRVGRAGLG